MSTRARAILVLVFCALFGPPKNCARLIVFIRGRTCALHIVVAKQGLFVETFDPV